MSDKELEIISGDPAMNETIRSCFSSMLEHNLKNTQDLAVIFRALDSLPISICVYDKDVRLIYCNREFCNYINLEDANAAYGMTLNDLLESTGIKMSSLYKPDNHMRVYDVIKYGTPILGWQVEVIYPSEPNNSMIATNDIYPIFDRSQKNTIGIVEVCTLQKKRIKEIRDTLGLTAEYTFENVIGESKQLKEAKRLAMAFASTPHNIMIYGESGVGKEIFAQSIHNHSERRSGPFVAINCASIPADLIDSELFGYESGAFTGASKKGRVGKFELASGGTLFLDEVAELPMYFQSKLLRTLETHQITRIGSPKNITVDVRVIAATNQSIEKMIDEGLFRRDLYYRLMVLDLEIPPLRDRPEDILLCAEFFLKQINDQGNRLPFQKTFSEGAKKMLMAYNWPGNVRELRNVINRVCIRSTANVITREELSESISLKHFARSLPLDKDPEKRMNERRQAVDRANSEMLQDALTIAGGNKARAAELMGVSIRTFYRLIEKYKA